MPTLNSLTAQDVQWGSNLWNNGFKNYLINGDFAINQRGFVGGDIGGVITGTTIATGGSGYTSAPTVAFAAPPAGGTQATGTAVITSGAVTSITINNPGAGYAAAPAITFSGGAGTGATATCAVNSTTGIYAFDRWKSGGSVCNISLSAGVLTHTSGPLVQVIEAPNLAGATITVSVDGLSGGNLSVNVEGVAGVIVPAAGRSGVSIAVPGTSTGNVTVTLTPASGAVTYKRVQVELGSVATAFEWRPAQVEIDMCLRYYLSTYEIGVAPGTPNANASLSTFVVGTQSYAVIVTLLFPVPMRSTSALTGYSPKSGAAGQCYRNNIALDAPVFTPGSSSKSVTWAVNATACTNEGLQFNFTADAEL